MTVDPLVGGRRRRKILFFLGEWVRLEVMERTGSSGRFEGEKSGKRKRGGSIVFFLFGGDQEELGERDEKREKKGKAGWRGR